MSLGSSDVADRSIEPAELKRVPSEKAQALVIRSVDFSETSRVLTLYTREFGKLGVMVKGGRRLRSPFAGALDLLSVCRIVLIRKHSGGLDLLTEAELVKGFSPQRNSLQFLYAGYYIAELLLELTEVADPHPQLFDVAVEMLRELESDGKVKLVLRRFELAILRETGHKPFLDGCVKCGSKLAVDRAVLFCVAAGGLVCPACAKTGLSTLRLSAGTVRILQQLGSESNDRWKRLKLMPGPDREIAALTRNSIKYLIGRNLRTAQFLGESPS